jgi:Transglutaminase-like superfamily
MLSNPLGLSHPEALDLTSPEARMAWLRETTQLDISTSRVRILAAKLTQLVQTDRNKAVVIHDHVKTLPFGCVADFLHTKASDVIKLGYGDCHTKGVLFVALLRAAHIPARLRFVTLPSRFLTGLIDTGSETMTHAIAEVYLDTRWVQTDTYVVDAALNREARELLLAENNFQGYGVHSMADQDWTGFDHAYAQCAKGDPTSLPVVDWGVDHDPAHFYADASHAALRHSFTMRVKWMLGAQIVNRKVEKIRQRAKDFGESLSSRSMHSGPTGLQRK